jgi:hypothetical protein
MALLDVLDHPVPQMLHSPFRRLCKRPPAGRLAVFGVQLVVAVSSEYERNAERGDRPTMRVDPGDRVHHGRGCRDGHPDDPGLFEQFSGGGGERSLTTIGTSAGSDPHVEHVMIDHQDVGAVVVEHPGPHHQLAEIVGGDRLEPGQGVTFDTCCRFGEETQPRHVADVHRLPRPDSFRVGAVVHDGNGRSEMPAPTGMPSRS